MEYMPRGTLFHFLADSTKELSWEICYQLSIDISSGMAFLHGKSIVHGDLKSLNVLLDINYRAKIADFGQAKIHVENATLLGSTVGGSLNYLAPELLERLQVLGNGQISFQHGAKTTEYSDIYSYGLVLWEITTRSAPFVEQAKKPLAEFQKFICQNNGREEHDPATESTKLREVINLCWFKNPESRPKVAKCLEAIEEEARVYGYTV
jgi:serine/threonine protein kinase